MYICFNYYELSDWCLRMCVTHVIHYFVVAHSEVFGYGFRAYEYLPGTLGPRDSSVRESEIHLGMSSMRSFIYPRFYILVSWLADICNIRLSPFLVI